MSCFFIAETCNYQPADLLSGRLRASSPGRSVWRRGAPPPERPGELARRLSAGSNNSDTSVQFIYVYITYRGKDERTWETVIILDRLVASKEAFSALLRRRWGGVSTFPTWHQREIVGEASCRLRQFFVLLLLRDPGLSNTFMKLEIRIKEKSKYA